MPEPQSKLFDPSKLPAPGRLDPVIGRLGPQGTYLGRVVIEVWDVPATSAGAGLAFTSQPAPSSTLNGRELLQRVAEGFAPRWQRARQTDDGSASARGS